MVQYLVSNELENFFIADSPHLFRSIAAAFARSPPEFIIFLGLQGIGSGAR